MAFFENIYYSIFYKNLFKICLCYWEEFMSKFKKNSYVTIGLNTVALFLVAVV